MNWPWVSRDAYDAMRKLAESERENAAVLRGLLLDVSAKYYDAVRPPAPPVPVTPPVVTKPKAKERDPVAVVIREQAGDNPRLANHLRSYAGELKRQGLTSDEIIGKLVAWQTSEPVDHAAQV